MVQLLANDNMNVFCVCWQINILHLSEKMQYSDFCFST